MKDPRRQKMLAGFEADNPADSSAPTEEPVAIPVAVSPPKVTTAEPVSVAGKTVYVVDSHSLIYQVFHAMPEMTGPNGQPVGAIHGFIRDVLDLIEKKQPDFLFCAFDSPGLTFRNELYEEYKANRAEMPIDLRPQIADIQHMLTALGVPTLACPNYEADDILATIAHQTESLGGTCVLVTGDKDCRQLITDHTSVYNIRKDEMFDAEALEREWGVRPEQVIDFQSLVGDSVDNIPGVPLIGPKIAGELLRQFGTLENLLDHVDEVNGTKRRENLKAFREQALLSRNLVRLIDDAPVEVDWRSGQVGGVNREAAMELCRRFGFRKLSERIVGLTLASAPSIWLAEYQAVTSLDHLQRLVDEMRRQPRIVIHTESTSTSPRWAELIGVSFAWEEGRAYYVPVRAPRGDPQLAEKDALPLLKPLLEDERVEKVGQNIKHDLIVLRSLGIQMRGVAFDTMVADYLLDPGERIHNVEDLSKRYLNHTTTKPEELVGSGKNQKTLDQVPLPQVTQYAAEGADVPMRISRLLEKRLAEEELSTLFHELEIPLVGVLAEMEFNGIKVDVERLSEMSHRFSERLEKLRVEIHQHAGGDFNIDSPKQLAKVLFEDLKLPVQRKTRTGPSTDADVLGDLAKLHPLPAKIIEYRQLAKLKGTYIDSLPQLVHPSTGRVHTSFKQDVAATGRLSSMDPNLQNIPIRSEDGREIRSAFLPGEKDWLLLAADYSQIELRVLAHYSGDEALRRAFLEDRDIHTQVAAEVYEVPLDAVTREMRRSAKAVNFGVIYGQSPFGLAKALDIDQKEAARFINTYFAKYSGVAAFIRQTLASCRKQNYVATILGRKRSVQGVRDLAQVRDPHQRTLPERIAINTVIQGSAADLIKRAMIQVDRRLRREQLRSRLLLQIHDELVFEFPVEEQEKLTALVIEEMSNAGQLAVPLKVDFKVGANWAECE
jgi:DNA polymerase-1